MAHVNIIRCVYTSDGSFMIRVRLKELIAEKEFRERRVVTLKEVSEATGIYRTTLTKIANEPGYNTGTENLDRLCSYFSCPIEKLLEHIPGE